MSYMYDCIKVIYECCFLNEIIKNEKKPYRAKSRIGVLWICNYNQMRYRWSHSGTYINRNIKDVLHLIYVIMMC